jgi:transcription elongation factor
MKAMEEARKLDVGPLLIAAAVVAAIATLWAAGAFAAGGSSSQGGSTGDAPPGFVQDRQAPPDKDCPEGGGGTEANGPSDGSGSADL